MEEKSLITQTEQEEKYCEEELRLFAHRLSGYVAGKLSPLIEAEIIKILELPEDFFNGQNK